MDESPENLEDEAEAEVEEERPLSVLWERCIQQSIFVDISDNDSLHLSDLQPGSFTICLNQDSPASETSLNNSENSELESSTEVDEGATETSVTPSGESVSGSSDIRHSDMHVSLPAGQTPISFKDKRMWRYDEDPVNTSDEDQEDLPYDGDLASQCVLSCTQERETSEKEDKTVYGSKNTGQKTATDLNSLCALNLQETGMVVSKLPNPEAAVPPKVDDATNGSGGKEQSADQSVPGEAAATSNPPQHVRGTMISDLLLRHLAREELLNTTELIDAETLPEVSLMESLDDTVVSLVSQRLSRHEPIDCGDSAADKRNNSQCEEEVDEDGESGDDRTVLSERGGEVSASGQRGTGMERHSSQEDEHCSEQSQSSSSPQPAKAEDSLQRGSLVRTRSFNDLKYGQGQVHYRLPDFSKVAPKVKIPKANGGARSMCPSPGILRAQSSPGMLAKSSASHVATMAVISRVLEDIIPPNDRSFMFREEEWCQGSSPQLQVEYDKLVAIKAEADNLVDRMVLADNVFKGMMDAQDQLERNYMAKKEEHRALEMQNYMGIAKNTGEFDPDRQVEGEIFRIGMLLEDVKEQIDANVCQSFSPMPSTSTPAPPPHHPQPPLHEDLLPSFSMSTDGQMEESEASGGRTPTGYTLDLTGYHSITWFLPACAASLRYSDASLERRENTHAAEEDDEEEERSCAPAEDEDDGGVVRAPSVSSVAKDRLGDTGR
ncbi:hypothetical protein ACEWY4_006282 [Coilia grayii]|uniref:Uncharacterized protein n=1 Tax=Coilia grayii TaxID=363190 RepID=A0ABD1KD00_9TELE